MKISHIDETPSFKAGDPIPEGYAARQEWAAVHVKAGLKEQRCVKCRCWRFPHQMSTKTNFICKECDRMGAD